MEILEIFPIVSFRGMSTGILLGRDLNPTSGFCFPLFSMVFSWGISIRVETWEVSGSKSVANCGRSTYKFSMSDALTNG
jgi:hypothetical protein